MNKIVREDIEWLIESGLPFERLEGKNMLVAGANSFLAAYMVMTVLYYNEKIAKEPCIVTGLVRNMGKAETKFSEYLARKDLRLICGDVCSYIDYPESQDYIIHAASQASPKYYGVDPLGTMLPNITGTYNLLELSKRQHCKSFLYFSSSEVYGEPYQEGKSLDEKSFGFLDCLTLRACYAEGKRAGETLCRIYHEKYGVDVKVVRPFHTYGPGMDLDDGRVYADFVRNAVKGEDIVLNSDGSAVRAFCYIRDAVWGFFKVLFDGKSGEAYNIASDIDVLSVKELAEIIASICTGHDIKVVLNKTPQAGYIKSTVKAGVPDIKKASGLGFSPKVRAKEGFKKTIQSYL
ncbi:MAG TPA: NAD-dependent epimerase/dehydratase family protein [Candidatus Goldiibacteriota bacterium]|nr:NAD-dependent epimerase/dehydratase family protein [Candidatus Goldiibacteriota bacterium]